MRPSVTVPVLSSTIVPIRRVCSSTSGPLITIPSCAPRPVPTMIAVGVASPSAQGQAMISTATAAVSAAFAPWPARSQATSVPKAITITIGTKTDETRSASRCTGAREPWASSTSRAICASAVFPPTLVASTASRPDVFTVAPNTASPALTSTGTGSPVSIDTSTADDPSTTRPSVAILSPGRTTNRSPTWRLSTGTSSPFSRRAVLAPSSSSARSAWLDRCLARASKKRPSSNRATITEAVSKYTWAASPPPKNPPIETPPSAAPRKTSATIDHVYAASVPSEISVSIVAAP